MWGQSGLLPSRLPPWRMSSLPGHSQPESWTGWRPPSGSPWWYCCWPPSITQVIQGSQKEVSDRLAEVCTDSPTHHYLCGKRFKLPMTYKTDFVECYLQFASHFVNGPSHKMFNRHYLTSPLLHLLIWTYTWYTRRRHKCQVTLYLFWNIFTVCDIGHVFMSRLQWLQSNIPSALRDRFVHTELN